MCYEDKGRGRMTVVRCEERKKKLKKKIAICKIDNIYNLKCFKKWVCKLEKKFTKKNFFWEAFVKNKLLYINK